MKNRSIEQPYQCGVCKQSTRNDPNRYQYFDGAHHQYWHHTCYLRKGARELIKGKRPKYR